MSMMTVPAVQRQTSKRFTGTVKWFNEPKGYGFIKPDDGDEDLFVHYTVINMKGFKTLKEGQRVVFEKATGQKGMHAVNLALFAEDEEVETDIAYEESVS